MQRMTLQEGHDRLWEAFEKLCAGKMTAKKYAQVFFAICEATTAHPVQRAVQS